MPEHTLMKATVAWGGFGYAKVAEARNPYGWSDWVWNYYSGWVQSLSAFGIHGWADFAGMVAGIYTCILIGEWAWKKFRNRRRS